MATALPQPRPASGQPGGGHVVPGSARGIEFTEVRTYQPGDDRRAIDWRQSARRGRLYTKLFQPERERSLLLWVDLGADMRFGTRGALKSVAAARAAACLAWAAVQAGDRIGALVWNEAEQRRLAPRGREAGALGVLAALAALSRPPAASGMTASPLRPGAPSMCVPAGSRLVLISGFAELDASAERSLALLAARAELVMLHVVDRLELQAPPPGRYALSDGRRRTEIDFGDVAVRADHEAAGRQRVTRLEAIARRCHARSMVLAGDEPPQLALQALAASPGAAVAALGSTAAFVG